MSGTRVYVGNLPLDVKEREVDELFYKVNHRQRCA
jgi:RNA recognition motif-containing protein